MTEATTKAPWRLSKSSRKLVLAVTGAVTSDPDLRSSAYMFMNLCNLALVIPLANLTLISGVLMGLGTNWRLFRYYWVAAKLVLTLLVLISGGAFTQFWVRNAIASTADGGDAGGLASLLLVNVLVILAVLLTSATLGFYKPWGRIRATSRQTGD